MTELEQEKTWLRDIRRQLGWSAADVAKRAVEAASAQGDPLSLTQQAVSNFENGGTKSVPRWLRFVKEAAERVDEVTMLGGGVPIAEIADQLDLVGIAQIDAQYGMGETFLQHHIEQEVKYFPRDWVQAITDSPPERLVWARGWGDSMAPTIQPTDLIMIDLSQTKVREQDVIWAAAVGDMGMIKRLRVRADGVTILSDNPNVSDDYATHDEIHIVGRVIFIGRRL